MPEDNAQSTALADLVRARKDELGIGVNRLGERCADPLSDVRVNGSWLQALLSGGPLTPPRLPQLRALAEGLDLPLPAIQEAANAQFHGVPPTATYVYPREGVRLLVHRASDLTDEDVELLAEMAQMLARKARERESKRERSTEVRVDSDTDDQ